MTPERLEAIAKRAAAATEGPWRRGSPDSRCSRIHNERGTGHGSKSCLYGFVRWACGDSTTAIHRDASIVEGERVPDGLMVAGMFDYEEGGFLRAEDAEFSAHARQDVPDLLAEVARLKAALDTARSALELVSGSEAQPMAAAEVRAALADIRAAMGR